MKIDRAFCDAIERADVERMRNLARNAKTQFPQLGVAACDIGGGIAVFAGADSALSDALNIGLWEPAGAAQVDELTAFYGDRGSRPNVRCSPYTDENFVRALIARGYVPIQYETLMAAELVDVGPRRDARVAEMADAQAWSRATGSAYTDGAAVDETNLIVGLILSTAPETTALEIRIDGAIAASGCMDVTGEISGFYGAATAPAFRSRGLHAALIADRAARAIERGARFARVTTGPGTTSEQNFRRIGFVPLYTCTVWGIPCSDSASAP